MGQYFKIVNLDKREYVEGGSKLWEWCANNEARLFPYLLATPNKDGTGELTYIDAGEKIPAGWRKFEHQDLEGKTCIETDTKYFGRWCGDRVVLAGDYAEGEHEGLYKRVKKEGWTDITKELVGEFNRFIGIEKLKVGKTDYIMPDMVAVSGGAIYTDPKIEVPQTENLSKPPSPNEQKSGPVEIAGGWRKHKTHREETQAVKKALEQAGIKAKVGHDTGTAWGWLVVNLGPNPSGLEHRKMEGTPTPWLCASGCPACERNRELRDQTLRIAQEATGRRGDYDGEIQVLTQ
jgi:hypothetical protein